MDTHAYYIKIPFEIGDLIKADKFKNEYIILDIIQTYSCKERSINNVYFKLKDTLSGVELMIPYNDYKWEMIKTNKELKNNE